MSVAGLGVVVTGAAGGIGRALAERLASEGARVVVNDLDPAATESAAEAIGAHAIAGDAASEAGITALVAASREHLGRIDAWFANAGIMRGVGLDSSEAEWAASWEVNVLSQVRAARLLVPDWLESGGGRFVVTASGAGLLTALTAPAYSTTKHAAVGFAEWLSATYRHQGIVVQAICPLGVRTDMMENSGPMKSVLERDEPVTAQAVADITIEAMGDDRFLILPHPQVAEYYRARADDTDLWLSGVSKLQQKLTKELEG